MSKEDFVRVNCGRCKTDFGMPLPLYDAAKNSSKISWFCPYGHERHFVEGESDLEKMRRRAERAEQNVTMWRDEVDRQREHREAAERSAAAYKGQTTRLKNRAKAGVCPCCNRHFENLERHMKSKHADMDPAEPLKVIDGGRAG